MEDNQNNKNIPDLGEGIKPEDVVYSSRDILGNSVAGNSKEFFTRVKKDTTLKKINLKKPKKASFNGALLLNNLKTLLKNKIFWIVFVTVLAVIFAVVVIFFIATQSRSTDINEPDDPAALTSEDEENESATEDSISSPEAEIIPDDIKALNPDNKSESADLTRAERLEQNLEYVNGLIKNSLFLTAGYKLEYLVQDIEDYPEYYTDCQRASLYRVIDQLYRTRGDDEDTIKPNAELLNKYQELCDAT